MAETRPATAEQELVVLDECLSKHLQLSYLASGGVCFVSVLFAVPAWFIVPQHIVIQIVLATFLYQGVILSISQWYFRQRRYTFSYRHRSIAASLIYGYSGVMIAIGCIVYYHYGGAAMLLYVMGIQLGLAEGSLGVSAYHVPAMYAYLLTSTPIFLIYLLFVERDFQLNVILVGLTFNTFYCIGVGLQQARNIRTAIRLQHRNDDLVSELREQTGVLQEARAEAEHSNQERARFFANASHDLRQPVHALNVYTALLRSSKTRSAREDILGRIEACVHTLADLFKALLTVARLENRDEAQEPAYPVPLQPSIDRVIALVQPTAELSGINLRVVPSSAWVQGEQTAIERILSNLLSNAIQFTKGGKVLIGVRRRPDHIELQVLDNGIGISETEQARIFGEFYQVDNPGRHAEKGYGLGLVIVQRLSASLGYQVKVRSRLGAGSCFSIIMPLAKPTKAQPSDEQRSQAQSLDPGIRVLVVDDDPVVRDAMQRILEDWSVAADIHASSAEALEDLPGHGEQWTCMLLDQRLAESVTGVELAQALNEKLGRPIPTAIMTGENAGTWMAQAHDLDYLILPKPVKLLRLRSFIAGSAKQVKAND